MQFSKYFKAKKSLQILHHLLLSPNTAVVFSWHCPSSLGSQASATPRDQPGLWACLSRKWYFKMKMLERERRKTIENIGSFSLEEHARLDPVFVALIGWWVICRCQFTQCFSGEMCVLGDECMWCVIGVIGVWCVVSMCEVCACCVVCVCTCYVHVCDVCCDVQV